MLVMEFVAASWSIMIFYRYNYTEDGAHYGYIDEDARGQVLPLCLALWNPPLSSWQSAF